jgi:Flp pilus assembly protein TadD
MLRQQGRLKEAETEYGTMLGIEPNDGQVHLCLAGIMTQLGRPNEAVYHLNEALRLEPDSAEVMNNLAWTLATCPKASLRDGGRAVQLAERACELTHYQKTIYLGTLAAAYAEAGRFDEAMATAEKACARAAEHGEQDLLMRNQELLAGYRTHQAYHEATAQDAATPKATPATPPGTGP